MVAWCNICKRPVNQYCDICGENFGVTKCDKYACGGTMMCPICGDKNLITMKEANMGPDPYDYSKKVKDGRISERSARERTGVGSNVSHEAPSKCPMCSFDLQNNWKFCPNCGVSFGMKK